MINVDSRGTSYVSIKDVTVIALALGLGLKQRNEVTELDSLRTSTAFHISFFNPLTGTLKPQSNGPLYSSTVIGIIFVLFDVTL